MSGEKELAEKGRMSFEPTVKIITLPCSSKVDTLGIIKAFERGADGIFVVGCPDDKCHLLGGNERARKIVNYTKRLLDEIELESDRLEMFQLGMPGEEHIDQVIETMTEKIHTMQSE